LFSCLCVSIRVSSKKGKIVSRIFRDHFTSFSHFAKILDFSRYFTSICFARKCEKENAKILQKIMLKFRKKIMRKFRAIDGSYLKNTKISRKIQNIKKKCKNKTFIKIKEEELSICHNKIQIFFAKKCEISRKKIAKCDRKFFTIFCIFSHFFLKRFVRWKP